MIYRRSAYGIEPQTDCIVTIVRKRSWLILTVLVLSLSAITHGLGGFLLGATIIAVPYVISLRLHPRTSHRACGGSGRHSSPLYPWGNRRCQGCGGSGRQVRHGSRAFGTVPVRAEHRAGIAARAKARANRTWR